MSATSEVPAAFRNAAGSRGPIALVREAISDIRSRRRLVRYLVQADVRKRGADTLLGNIWWVLDPLLQMLVYVIFITIIVPRTQPDYPLFIFSVILPWKWFSASVSDATTSIVRQDALIKQIQFPKIVLPIAATTAGIVSFAFGTVALALVMLAYSDRIIDLACLHPGHRERPVRVHPCLRVAGRGRKRLLPRPWQRRRARPAVVVVPVARPVQPRDPRPDQSSSRRIHGCPHW